MFDDLKFTLIRILGNDLVPRHKENQTYENLKFILDNEYDFENCTKHFILNRIVDKDKQQRLIELLGSRGYSMTILFFIKEEYERTENKEMYLTNLNQARNYFLNNVPDNTVVLPLDGNCFFRLDGWLRFCNSLEYNRGYAAIQMARALSYPDPYSSELPKWFENWRFQNKIVTAPTEPQIAFLPGFDKKYDETLMYSEASKIGLLYTIGYRGVWDNWYPELRARSMMNKSKYYNRACEGGWCFRLPSGIENAETDNQLRASLRKQGLQNLVEYANSRN